MPTDIESILPHRAPFLWIDRVLSVEPGVRCVAVKFIDPAEPMFAGHFPGDPIMPGVLLVEAAAQTAGVMLGAGGRPQGTQKRLAGISKFKFTRAVRPGDTIEIETKTLAELDGIALVSAVITCAGETVATGDLSVSAK